MQSYAWDCFFWEDGQNISDSCTRPAARRHLSHLTYPRSCRSRASSTPSTPPTNGSSPPSSLEQIEALEFHHRRRVRWPSTRGRSSSSPPAPHARRFQSTRGCGRAPSLELLGGDVAHSTGHAADGEQRVW
jgi:hypothetical protein